MKTAFLFLNLVCALLASRATAQTFKVLHTFTALTNSTNSDGTLPFAGLVLSGNILYGTAYGGGNADNGTIFKINLDGTGFTNLHCFSATFTNASGQLTNSDGTNPRAALLLSGSTLYGAATGGGGSGYGTLFKLDTNGLGFTVLHNFTLSDGKSPRADLILSGNSLYGTTYYGGDSDAGTVFSINTDGTAFESIYSFPGGSGGGYPSGQLILTNDTFYGTASFAMDGLPGYGSVYKLDISGIAYPNLHNFAYVATPPGPQPSRNSDGANPYCGLVLLGTNLYGTTRNGGAGGSGDIFRVDTYGVTFTNFHSFNYIGFVDFDTNVDGGEPVAGLTWSGNTFYGTTTHGGTSPSGTIYKINPDGTGFATLYNFTALSNILSGYTVLRTNGDGGISLGGLVVLGNTLYGTASEGGSAGNGTIFSLTLPGATPPLLTATRSGTNLILTWPTNPAFNLQSTTNLIPPTIWSAVSPSPAILNGQNTVTNPLVGAQKFYRLSQ